MTPSRPAQWDSTLPLGPRTGDVMIDLMPVCMPGHRAFALVVRVVTGVRSDGRARRSWIWVAALVALWLGLAGTARAATNADPAPGPRTETFSTPGHQY